MKLYHGSNVIVKEPRLLVPMRTLDFGSGFYTASNYEQAVEFSLKVMLRTKTSSRFVTEYEFDLEKAEKTLELLRFHGANEDWLNFVLQNRKGTYSGKKYDIIIGPVANDDVYQTLRLFETGNYSFNEALIKLKIKNLFDQYVFTSEKALSMLTFKTATSEVK